MSCIHPQSALEELGGMPELKTSVVSFTIDILGNVLVPHWIRSDKVKLPKLPVAVSEGGARIVSPRAIRHPYRVGTHSFGI